MKKFITFLVLTVMFVPSAFAAELSNDGSLMVETGHPKNVSCLWYLPNYRYLLADWYSHVNPVIQDAIDDILEN